MKTPTKSQLTALAVRALGEGATVEVFHYDEGSVWVGRAQAGDASEDVYSEMRSKARVVRALAAALGALAEVRK